MFEAFYEMYEPEEQEVVALINRCIGGGYNWKGKFWGMTVDKGIYRHYRLFTYDDVYNIIAVSYEFAAEL